MSPTSRAALILVLGVIALVGFGKVSALAARPAATPVEHAFDGSEEDDVAPSIAVSRAKVSQLRRPRGAYSLRLGLVIRDDVEGNPVGYTVVVKAGSFGLARKIGTTASGTISLALRIRPRGANRSIRVVITAIDPVGNEASLARTMRLPR